MKSATEFEIIGHSANREAWLRLRRTGIGASDSPAILGASSWASPVSVYADKIDADAPIDAENEVQEWGKILEPVILRHFEKVTGRAVFHAGELLRSTRWPFMLATLDGWQAHLSERWSLPLEAKNTWMSSNWTDGVPRDVWIQVQHQLAVTGRTMGSVAVLMSGFSFKWADVKRDDDFIENHLVPDLTSFWERVENGGPPPPADGNPATMAALARIYPEDDGESISLDGEFTDLAFELNTIKVDQKIMEQRRLEIENRVRAGIGDATIGALQDGGSFSWKADKNGKRTLRFKPAPEA